MSTNISKSKRIVIADESSIITSDVNRINFTGTAVTATNVGNDVTVNITGGGVTSVTASTPVVATGTSTPVISLASAYGDTLNPYASKTANHILAAPNGTAGVPTFRAIVAADIPTLNQNTTGTAANVTGIVAKANGGTGTATPSLVAGTNVTITGSWPNQTINAAGGGGGGGVTQIVAGTNVTISPAGGTGVVTVNAAGGGGAASGVHFLIPRGTNSINIPLKINSKANTTCTTATNRMTLMPYIPNNTLSSSFSLIYFKVNVVTSSATNFKILVFSEVLGNPYSKIYESPSISCATTGVKEIQSQLTSFSAGTRYWIGTITDSAGATLTQYSPDSMIPIQENPNLTSESYWFVQSTSYSYASVPATVLAANFTPSSINCPAVMLGLWLDL